MKCINATTIGNLISAHYEGDSDKFDVWVKFIMDTYIEQDEQIKATIIEKHATGAYKKSPTVTLDDSSEMQMTDQRALELLKIERECICRNSARVQCDRECEKCDLVQETDELIAMYDHVISNIEQDAFTQGYEAAIQVLREHAEDRFVDQIEIGYCINKLESKYDKVRSHH